METKEKHIQDLPTTTTISVIIVHYNAPDELFECLQSLRKYCFERSPEVIVIDNASRPENWDNFPKEDFQDFRFITLKKNIGFGAANNVGAQRAQSEYLFFMNPDVTLQENSFPILLGEYEDLGNAGILAPKLMNPDGSLQPSRGTFPHLMLTITQLLRLKRFLPRDETVIPLFSRLFGKAFAQWRLADELQQIDYCTGAAFLISREKFEKIGGFDENFFLYFEEIDLCKRLSAEGMSNYYTPKTAMRHTVDTAQEPVSGFKEYHRMYSLLYYYWIHHSNDTFRKVLLFLKVLFFFRFLSEDFRFFLTGGSKREPDREYRLKLRNLLSHPPFRIATPNPKDL